MSDSELGSTSFKSQHRVYYEHTDAGGVVYHANYLNFMERCRCDWLEAIGYDVVSLEREHQLQWVVKHADVEFHAPARLFDLLSVTCSVLQVGKVRLEVQQSIYNNDQLLCSARIKLATLNSETFKLTAMPQVLIQAMRQGRF